jgi:hypothetical protein
MLKNFSASVFPFKAWHGLIILVLCEMALSWYYQTRIFTLEVYQSLYADRLETDRIADVFQMFKKLSGWSYFLIPIIIWLRLLLMALLLQMPLVFRFIDIPFKEIFKLVTFASFVLVAMELVRLFYLCGIPSESVTMSHLTFMPLAVPNFLSLENVSNSSILLLNHLNLFEFIWLILLYYGLSSACKINKKEAGFAVAVMWSILLTFEWMIRGNFEKLAGQ